MFSIIQLFAELNFSVKKVSTHMFPLMNHQIYKQLIKFPYLISWIFIEFCQNQTIILTFLNEKELKKVHEVAQITKFRLNSENSVKLWNKWTCLKKPQNKTKNYLWEWELLWTWGGLWWNIPHFPTIFAPWFWLLILFVMFDLIFLMDISLYQLILIENKYRPCWDYWFH